MDWDRAIAINQAALARIVAALIAMVGLAGGVTPARLKRPVYTAVIRILRPAESAARRLIILVARTIVVTPRPIRPMPAGLAFGGARTPRVSFQLFDPLWRLSVATARPAGPRPEPRIFVMAAASPLSPLFFRPPVAVAAKPKADDGMVAAQRLGRRLTALRTALADLPREAKRLKRWQARRQSMAAPKFRSPLRPGPPPGHREGAQDEVDVVLARCHALAREALSLNSS